ncbi:DNA recombination protein RmuC [Oharaeibacter diazotrophicus]|uniref:DNA recombination protein RmuC homolog n=1 Tax=Oharaeibacter diazotrophicus TaxID=1920512 RepID=A0A4R6R8Z6_9HYPH|nr:DNA recombination protein RmuC [Oharaeibacter diazotrophicus]TDP82520.1 DNA recombination protein RmuC [Oharaeibacter diazotrophicus]BBE72716.1 DNA recombination protein RmuC [Pleomorphomonas sp. SM30]GLS76751.1 DNA recombinase [Oharaeibacter diazotrophicus]
MIDRWLEDLRRLVAAADPLALLAGALLLVALAWWAARRRPAAGAAVSARVDELLRLNAETTARLQTMAEILGGRQAELARSLGERIDGLGQRVGANLAAAQQSSGEQLERLAERLAVIDRAQKSLGDLAGEVVSLRRILGDKQRRGAFGQGRMEAIVEDGLPAGAFTFQATLSNGNRPDCVVHMPGEAPLLVIDAKFPLESFERLRAADGTEAREAAAGLARRDLLRHVVDVRQRYFVPGETQDTALIFVPSESLFADIHEHFGDVVERAGRARVLFVSPSLLMLSVQLTRAVLRDARMREQAALIQAEVRHLVDDVDRLRERTLNLQKHFGQASRDVEQILVSTDKIVRRGGRIDDVAFDEAGAGAAEDGAAPATVRAAARS